MKSFTVFNADQLKGHQPNKNTGKGEKFNHQAADHFIANTKALIKHGGESAYYSTTGDYINMPEMQDFIDTRDATPEQSYYGVLLHELTHWTKHVKRLDRKKSNKKRLCV